MSTFEELSSEMKQKIQGTIQGIEMLQKFLDNFNKGKSSDTATEKLISDTIDNNITSFNFTGQYTDLSYFSQSSTMPLSAIKNIGDENIKEAVKQNFDKAAQQGLIELDGDNIKITAKGKNYINNSNFIKAAQADQMAAYQQAMVKMASANIAENEVQMCVGLRGNYYNDFTAFNHTDKIDLSTVINHPNKELSKQVLSNVKKWQSGGFVDVKNGVATITQQGKAVLQSAGFKAASVPLTEGTVAAVGNVPGAVIVATKRIISTAVQAIQSANTTIKR